MAYWTNRVAIIYGQSNRSKHSYPIFQPPARFDIPAQLHDHITIRQPMHNERLGYVASSSVKYNAEGSRQFSSSYRWSTRHDYQLDQIPNRGLEAVNHFKRNIWKTGSLAIATEVPQQLGIQVVSALLLVTARNRPLTQVSYACERSTTGTEALFYTSTSSASPSPSWSAARYMSAKYLRLKSVDGCHFKFDSDIRCLKSQPFGKVSISFPHKVSWCSSGMIQKVDSFKTSNSIPG